MSGIIGSAGANSGKLGQTELDYEEGTYDTYINSNSSVAAGTNIGKYTKIGNMVVYMFIAQSNNLASAYGTNNLNLPLPFTTRANDTSRFYIDFYFQSSGTASILARAHCNGGNAYADLYHMVEATNDGTGAGTPIVGNDAGTGNVLLRGNMIQFV